MHRILLQRFLNQDGGPKRKKRHSALLNAAKLRKLAQRPGNEREIAELMCSLARNTRARRIARLREQVYLSKKFVPIVCSVARRLLREQFSRGREDTVDFVCRVIRSMPIALGPMGMRRATKMYKGKMCPCLHYRQVSPCDGSHFSSQMREMLAEEFPQLTLVGVSCESPRKGMVEQYWIVTDY